MTGQVVFLSVEYTTLAVLLLLELYRIRLVKNHATCERCNER